MQCVDCPISQPIDIIEQSAGSVAGTGGTLSVTINHADGLEASHDYVWRARSVDGGNPSFKSNWVNFGIEADGDPLAIAERAAAVLAK